MNPVYPGYAAWESRLSTYEDKTYKTSSKCSHSIEELAVAGFFYAGYEDCVRCFHCGLGLKTWRPGDNVYVEHQRHRPDCRFLQVLQESKEQVDFNLLHRDEGLTGMATCTEKPACAEELSVLQKENKYLKQRQFCKVCFRSPAREIFLPCGHILVCEPCSSIINQCTTCYATISATASVFFA